MFEKVKKTFTLFGHYIFSQSKNTIKIIAGLSLSLLTSALNSLPVFAAIYLNNREREKRLDDDITQKIYIGLGTSFLLAKLTSKLKNAVIAPVSTNVQNALSMDLLRKCFDFSLKDYLNIRTGEFARVQSSNQITVDKIIPTVFGEIIPFGMDAIAITLALSFYGPVLGAVPLVVIGSHSLVSFFLINPSNKAKRESRDKGYSAFGKLLESLMAYFTAHQFGNIDHEMEKVLPLMKVSEQQRLKAFQIDNLTSTIQIICNYTGLGFTFFYAGRLLSQKLITANDLAAITYLMFYFSTKLEGLSPSLVALQTAYLESQKIIDFFDRPSQEQGLDSYPLELQTPPRISFEGVDFTYESQQLSFKSELKNITFSIEPDKTLAIVGQSGAGKSTIIQLLMGFYQVDKGEIKINGNNIDRMRLTSLRDHITVVPQEPHLFSGTVRDNIRYGKLNATDEEIEIVAAWACLVGEVNLDSDVGTGGKKLSGGQRQRVGIARAILRGGLIFVLDEATSALDPEKEKEVQKNLSKVKNGATTLIITHKLYSLKEGIDQILYMENGQIIESGTFYELLSQQGRFYEQYITQCKELGIKFEENFDQVLEEEVGNTNMPYYSITQAFFNRKFKEKNKFEYPEETTIFLNKIN